MAAYQVLARKWRPKNFADLVGQQHVVKALQNALDKGRLHHAYLLTGTRGVGKTTIARILAKSLNCENPHHGEPCGACNPCQAIDSGRFVDLLEIDAASNTGIDNIREVLENAQYAPTAGKYKVYIIDEVHMLSKSAFNAMLKTLEEPPEHVKFILATTDPHKVPITVLSRCLQFVLRNMTAQQVTEHLTHVLKSEQIIYEPAALNLLGQAAQGSMRDALSLLDQAIAMGSGSVKEADVREMIGAVDKRYLYELATYLMQQDGEQLIAKAQEMSANAIGFDGALNDLAMLFQRLALLKTVPTAIDPDDPERERLLQLAKYFSDEQIQLYYQCVIHGKKDLPLAPDEYAGFVMTLLRMLAFAPFAAKNTPLQGTVEGSQLHSPETESPKKTVLPEKNQNAVSGSLKSENLNEIKDPNIKQFAPQDLPPPQPTEIKRAPQPQPPQIDVSPPTDDVAVPPHSVRGKNVDVPMSYHDDGAEYIPFEDLPTTPPPKIQPQPERTTRPANKEIIKEQPENQSALMQDVDLMPELIGENWHQIMQKIGTHTAAAQMMLPHLAWLDFDGEQLTLALSRETQRNPEYIQRIERALQQAYRRNIRLKIEMWQPEMNVETHAMTRKRIAQERKQAAHDYIAQSPATQQMLAIFGGKWREGSIELVAD